MLLHAVIVDLYYNSDMTHSRVDRAAPTYIYIYIVGVYVWIGGNRQHALHSAGHTACPAERKATEAVSMQKLTGIVAWLGNDSQTTSM